MSLNKASDIAVLLTARLQTITIANGYLTDIGDRVYRGRKKIEDDFAPCVSIIEGDDRIEDENHREVVLEQEYAFHAYMPCDPDNPNDAAHLAIKDLKRARFGDEANSGRQVQKVRYIARGIGPRPDGVAIVLAVVMVAVRYAEVLTDA